MGKSIRFAALVKKAGHPEVATLWQDPEKDPGIRTAIRQNRVLIKKARNVSYLIFPKSLPKDIEGRVIGIKYDLVEPKLQRASQTPNKAAPVRLHTGRHTAAKATVAKTPPASPAAAPVKTEKEFFVVVRKTAVWETTVKVEAESKSEAAEQAVKRVKEQSIPLSDAIVEVKSRQVKGS